MEWLTCLFLGGLLRLTTALVPMSRRESLNAATMLVGSAGGGLESEKLVVQVDSPVNDANIALPRTTISMPRIGYSLYKTPTEQVPEGVRLALAAGVRHYDVATAYGTTAAAATVLHNDISVEPISMQHKVSNTEQSTSVRQVKQAVRRQLRALPSNRASTTVLLHSPVTDRERRISSYAALAELQASGTIDAIGVAHFGVGALNELVVTADLPVPQLIQLELSPFSQHRDIIDWAQHRASVVQCAAFSKLSSVNGPQEGWARLGAVATTYGCTKQQILIRWAIQKGYACVPRSNSRYKVERAAIQENSWGATKGIVISDADMKLLDRLDEQIAAGRLGLVDGWEEGDILDGSWDPTIVV